jgi:hypothetical protein
MVDVLDTAKKYYAEVLKPQYDEFLSSPATFRNAFNLAGSLFHFHEWLYEDYKPQLSLWQKASYKRGLLGHHRGDRSQIWLYSRSGKRFKARSTDTRAVDINDARRQHVDSSRGVSK